MTNKTWKQRERTIAKLFGSTRTPLSGGNSKQTRSDTLHPELFIEHKHRKTQSIFNLFEETKTLARKESKIPVVTLSQHRSNGSLVCVHSSQLTQVLTILSKENKMDDQLKPLIECIGKSVDELSKELSQLKPLIDAVDELSDRIEWLNNNLGSILSEHQPSATQPTQTVDTDSIVVEKFESDKRLIENHNATSTQDQQTRRRPKRSTEPYSSSGPSKKKPTKQTPKKVRRV